MKDSLAVDGSCLGNPGKAKYRGVNIDTGEVVFSTNLGRTTNNICEFVALVHGVGYAVKNDIKIVYTDSMTAIAWFRNRKTKSTLKDIESTKAGMFTKRCEAFLKQHTIKSVNSFEVKAIIGDKIITVKKWNTKKRGEIPADYGNKR